MTKKPQNWKMMRRLILLFLLTQGSLVKGALDCGVFLAPSSIPGAGLGMFAGHDYAYGENVTAGDIVIPLIEFSWHNRRDEDGDDEYDETFWLWDEYFWNYELVPEMEMETESSDLHAASPGVGAAVNCFFPRNNIHGSVVECGDQGLHRSRDHGIGAFTPYHNRISWATVDIAAGDELFMSYGENYFSSRENIYGRIPFLEHFDEADILLERFQNFMEGIEAEMTDKDTNETTILWQDLYKVIKSLDTRTTNALPPQMPNISHIWEIGGTVYQYDERSRKSIEWLNEHGSCMDHIIPGPSTIKQAGRGAFASRFLPKGTIVAPAPLIHIPNRTVMNMYKEIEDEEGYLNPDTSQPIHTQLLLNYCFGHPKSTVLLSPYGVVVNLINHHPEKANVRMQWSEKLTKHSEWLEKDPSAMDGEYHAGLVMDFVAIRDIEEGEEVFLDYGIAWEKAWQKFEKEWKPPPKADKYMPAYMINNDVDHILLAFYEGGYADHLKLWLYTEYYSFQCIEDVNVYFLRAQILDRYEGKRGETLYMAETFRTENLETQTSIQIDTVLFGLPRDAFTFDDVAYTRDHHQTWSFRHEIHVPDDIFPEAWKNLEN